MKNVAVRTLLLPLLAAGVALPAGGPSVTLWTAASMKQWPQKLASKFSAQGVATDALGTFGNYRFMAIVRKASGQAEFHENDADIMIVQSGDATLITGGTVINPKTTEPHEIRGSGIQGGREMRLVPGDVVTVPAKTPHQVKLAPGTEFVYMTVKVSQ